MKTLGVALLAMGVAVGVAPTAAAAESEYLGRLHPRLSYLTNEQLLSEGYRICQVLAQGRPNPDAVPMVTKDLYISVSAAMEIVAAAAVELC